MPCLSGIHKELNAVDLRVKPKDDRIKKRTKMTEEEKKRPESQGVLITS